MTLYMQHVVLHCRLLCHTPLPSHCCQPLPLACCCTSLLQTELCRSWQQHGSCRYGARCQFAHGAAELRPLVRHPKYRTQPCRTFALAGRCPYGERCTFIHGAGPAPLVLGGGAAGSAGAGSGPSSDGGDGGSCGGSEGAADAAVLVCAVRPAAASARTGASTAGKEA